MSQNSTRVLLVEDNVADARLVAELLSEPAHTKFDLDTTDRLDDAIERLAEGDYRILLLDLSLPDASGLETVRRAQSAAPNLPIVVMTGLGDEDTAIEAVKLGAQDYLVKGAFAPDLLERSIRYAIERKDFEKRLVFNALHDELTGLPNRASFIEHLDRALLRAKDQTGPIIAVLSVDLDRFTAITGSYGYPFGDRLVRIVGDRLRECAGKRHTLARVGRDQFLLLMPDARDIHDVVAAAERITSAIERPVRLGGEEILLTASIGIATSATPYDVALEYLRDSEIAMHRARSMGGGRSELFDSGMYRSVRSRVRLENELRHSVDRDELSMHYQPLVSLVSGRIVAFEALLRWNHPERGLLPASDFIGVADETALLQPTFERLLPVVLDLVQGWQSSERAGMSPAFVNVNLSQSQFSDPDLLSLLDDALARRQVRPYSLGFEITESAVMDDPDKAAHLLAELSRRGVRLYLDDFGTGYSSLSRLHRFPIDGLKIDRSFVSAVGVYSEASEIVRAIITLAHTLNMSVTAEGVETRAQLELMKQLKCELAQGFFFSAAVAPDAATALLHDQRTFDIGSTSHAARADSIANEGNVLVVDDDLANRNLMRILLEEQGFEVLTAGTGAECLEKAEKWSPEIILLDIEMPGMDGIDTCRRLKREPHTANVPVLFVTGHRYDEPTVVEALSAGGNDFLSKDAAPPVLFARVRCQISIFRSQEKLRQTAMFDELTGVYSRRFLFDSLRRAAKAASRGNALGLACLLADVDHFKRINDTLGHMEGDQMLRAIAQTIDGATRDTDLVARFGGEEFVVVLSDTDLEGAVFVAERIRKAVETGCPPVTISIGVAFTPSPDRRDVATPDSLDDLIQRLLRRADEAMYRAKEVGRNRTEVW